ncbi:4800_t:CDS:1, partial [Cetraspora pellucida]
KKVNLSTPILANYNNIPLFNPINIDANNLCKYLKQIYSTLFDISYNYSKSKWTSYSSLELDKFESIDNLTIHLYEDAIVEHKEERSMQDLQLIDFKELELHSFDNYANALKMIINIPSLNNYLNQNIISIITDWPGQLFIRKIITYLKIQQLTSNIPQIYKNFHPIMGPLHVALN